jgi:hypothetical protein
MHLRVAPLLSVLGRREGRSSGWQNPDDLLSDSGRIFYPECPALGYTEQPVVTLVGHW